MDKTIPEIRARRLVITDSRDRERIILGLLDGHPAVTLLDYQGNARAELRLSSGALDGEQAFLNIGASDGYSAELYAAKDGATVLLTGNGTAGLDVGDGSMPSLVLDAADQLAKVTPFGFKAGAPS